VNDEHGDAACVADRHEMCALRIAGAADGWGFLHCAFENLDAVAADPEAALAQCAANLTATSWDEIHACATNATSAEWMRASGAATAADAGGAPLWVVVDGADVTDGAQDDHAVWAAEVLGVICADALSKGIALPAGCVGAERAAVARRRALLDTPSRDDDDGFIAKPKARVDQFVARLRAKARNGAPGLATNP